MSLTKKLNQNLFNIILLFFFTISNGFAENKIVGKAKVIDGDTIKIKNINGSKYCPTSTHITKV